MLSTEWDVTQYDAQTNRNEQQRLEILLNGKPEQEASHEDHNEVAPRSIGEACICKELVEVRYYEF